MLSSQTAWIFLANNIILYNYEVKDYVLGAKIAFFLQKNKTKCVKTDKTC